MKFPRTLVLCLLLALPKMAAAGEAENFDAGWKFSQGDATNAGDPGFDDRDWQTVSLPHDWSIAGPFAETNKTGGAGAFLPDGVVCYRKHFSLPESDSGKTVSIGFDGVMANSDVWINGFHLGHRPNGYVSFSYGLTGHLNFGGDNVIAVRCDTSQQPASRWYAGAGIYRHARLVVTDPVHFLPGGIFISTPEVSSNQATVHIEMSLTNQTEAVRHVDVINYILAPGQNISDADWNTKIKKNWLGTPMAPENHARFKRAPLAPPPFATLAPNSTVTLTDDLTIPQPELWNLDRPQLYRLVTRVVASSDFTNGFGTGEIVDETVTPFGIRDAHFEADTGFWLNGKNFKIKGVCLHADGGAFGAAVPLSVWEARLKALKALGVNAIRTAHNPPAPEFLDLCDRMGFLVMDEFFDCWEVGKNRFDYHLFFDDWSARDEHDTILRDRNHPSIIIYSVGNEIHDTPNAEKAKAILTNLVAVAHAADPTRPVTQALFRPNVSGDYTNGLADLLDVVGQNYREKEILAAHEQNPARKILGTENTHVREQWVAMRDHAPYAGQFLWTGVDYLGESRRWPRVGHGSGLLDRTGEPRAVGFERQSWWSDAPMVYAVRRIGRSDAMPTDPGYAADERYSQVLFHDWTPPRPAPHDENVEVYSNCKEVELFLNGRSLGAKPINADASARNWTVPFAPGVLKAVARDKNRKVVATDELKTAGAPAKILLTTETRQLSPGFDNLAIVRATITDASGVPVPNANDLVSFSISGPGEIAAVDNADNSSHESFQSTRRHAYQGECVAFVRAAATKSGKIKLTAQADGLKSSSIVIRATR
jgi:beta-galactosidase